MKYLMILAAAFLAASLVSFLLNRRDTMYDADGERIREGDVLWCPKSPDGTARLRIHAIVDGKVAYVQEYNRRIAGWNPRPFLQLMIREGGWVRHVTDSRTTIRWEEQSPSQRENARYQPQSSDSPL
jgi:hypothetical protein